MRYKKGGISYDGYKSSSPDKDNDFNIIPSGRITMKGVPHFVMGIDNFGNRQLMQPGGEYNFPGQEVYEIPLKGNRMKNGGAASGHPGQFWDGNKWVSSQGGATYNNGVFYQEGGPVFPVGGAAPIFANGGYMGVNPFAMWPGSGEGSGMLQDLPTQMVMGGTVHPFAMNPGPGTGTGILQEYAEETMKKGGKHHKSHPKLSPQQMQQLMVAMQQSQQMPPQQMGMPPQNDMMSPPMGQPPMGGQMLPPQGPPMAHGGIHIKKSHEGRFTAYKKRTGKTTEEALHSKDPHVRQMANFARNAAKWHHEYGGMTMQNMHPLMKFMQAGGQFGPDGRNPEDETAMPPYAPVASNYNTGMIQDPVPAWRQGMTDQQAQSNINYGTGSVEAFDPTTGNTDNGVGSINGQSAGNWNGWNKFSRGANTALGTLGSGLAIANMYSNLINERDNAAYQRQQGTSDHIARIDQPGGYGDWDRQGAFRPNQNTPSRPGMFYPQMNNGGMYQQGGMYDQGQELEMDDTEIERLRKMGYKIDVL